MAPITNPERYEGSVDFWCDVYGIDSKLLYNPFKSFNMPCRCHQNLGGDFCMQYDDLKLFAVVSALVPLAKKFTSEEPSIETIGGENVISWPSVVSLGEVSNTKSVKQPSCLIVTAFYD